MRSVHNLSNHKKYISKDISIVESILGDYDHQCPLYSDFKDKIKSLISELLKENNFKVHSIEARVKDKDSLREKLVRSEGRYLKLSDITDITGI
ncbi:MAG: hypothetical protein AB1480_13355 [Nitrospirota bacterium]